MANKQFLQEAFEFSVKGVMAQDGLAQMSNDHPVEYKTLAGNKCAFGQFILDSEYDRILEGRGPIELIDLNHKRDFLNPHFNYYNKQFYGDLQKAHDSSIRDCRPGSILDIKKKMIAKYIGLAARYELDGSFLQNIYIFEENNNPIRISKR